MPETCPPADVLRLTGASLSNWGKKITGLSLAFSHFILLIKDKGIWAYSILLARKTQEKMTNSLKYVITIQKVLTGEKKLKTAR